MSIEAESTIDVVDSCLLYFIQKRAIHFFFISFCCFFCCRSNVKSLLKLIRAKRKNIL